MLKSLLLQCVTTGCLAIVEEIIGFPHISTQLSGHLLLNETLASINCVTSTSHWIWKQRGSEPDLPDHYWLKAGSPDWLWSLWSYTWFHSLVNWRPPPEMEQKTKVSHETYSQKASKFSVLYILHINSDRAEKNVCIYSEANENHLLYLDIINDIYAVPLKLNMNPTQYFCLISYIIDDQVKLATRFLFPYAHIYLQHANTWK